ncbi:hypothetical protein EOD41_17720 [Mucilaginibacter limnophilus]|uniref:Uncharacterized protein n=1 Tax=Mucilaginibacter limnophilus TaxID=1932778 RepID=A0A3S2WWC9_9SPHI|nr:hypothetical protein [Mucilaginibacter limnophilus]RVT98210.1 hypothetical protein EOD41_17720 [Mucilaginibacter limnophilus]
MIKKALFIMLAFTSVSASAQNLRKIEAEITDEANAMYKSEWASWYGTDVFQEKCANIKGQQGGYLSYDNGSGLINVFYSKEELPQVIATINFGYGFDANKYFLDTLKREFNKQEKALYGMRKAAIDVMYSDTTFKYYQKSSLNPVPLIYKNTKKVYVLTGTNTSGVVLFGNDYQIDFDKNDKIKGISKLHNSLIPAYFKNNEIDSSKIQKAAMHNHIKGKSEFITVTDVCTLMLYSKFTTWQTYYVITDKYVSIWDCKKSGLVILTREAWDKISRDQKKKQTVN